MRRPRALVRAALTGAAATSATPAAITSSATLQQQQRWVGHVSRPVLAPRRRRSAEEGRVPQPPAPSEATADAVAAPFEPVVDVDGSGGVSQPTAPSQPSVADAAHPAGRVDAAARNPAEAGSAAPSRAAPAQPARPTTARVFVSDGALAATERRIREAHRQRRLQQRFLVGAHTALHSKAGEDCRADVPCIAVESMATLLQEHTGATADVVQLRLTLPSTARPSQAGRPIPSAATPAASPPLSAGEAVRAFAHVFALTLHTTAQAHRTRVSAGAAPCRVSASADRGVAPAAVSFLASPTGVCVAPPATTTPAMALSDTRQLRSLEVSFMELCARLTQDLFAAQQAGAAGAPSREVPRHVQAQAAALLHAVEEASRAPNGQVIAAMRRQCQRNAAEAATRASASRKRKTARVVREAKVEDTLQNTLERVGQELHLIHAYVLHLCSDATPPATAVVCVARRAAHWDGWDAAADRPLSLADVRWMFAVALLEHVHTRTYRFHHAQATTAVADGSAPADAGASGGRSRRPTLVVDAHQLRGLAALVDFALERRLESTVLLVAQLYGYNQETFDSARLMQQHALLEVLSVFYTLLPTYTALLPAWHRVHLAAALTGAPVLEAPQRLRLDGDDDEDGEDAGQAGDESEEGVDLDSLLHSPQVAAGKDGGSRIGNGMHVAAEAYRAELTEAAARRAAAASAVRVWESVMRHWARQQSHLRSEGASAAVWWLQLLPHWIGVATGALQLQVVLLSCASRQGRSGVRSTSTDPVVALQTHAAALLSQVLYFDRREYERRFSARRPASLLASSAAGALAGGVPASQAGTSDPGDARAGEAAASEGGEVGDGSDAAEDAPACGEPLPPPLRRQRGKRSLFYKSPEEAAGGVLAHESAAAAAAAGGRGSRFTARSRTARLRSSRTNAAGSLGSSGGTVGVAGSAKSAATGAAAAGGDVNTSPVFAALVFSEEAPAVLSALYHVTLVNRQRDLEVSWAATASAKEELWRLLYALPPAAAVAAAAAQGAVGGGSRNARELATLLRNALPASVVALLDAATADSDAGSTPAQEAALLGRVLCVVLAAQRELALPLFESVQHVLVATAQALLRIEQVAITLNSASATPGRSTHLATARDLRHRREFVETLVSGATVLLTGNPLHGAGARLSWQLLQQRRLLTGPAAALPSSPTELFVTAAVDDFVAELQQLLSKGLYTLLFVCGARPDVVLANATAVLELLRDAATAARLPLQAKQFAMGYVLRCVSTLAGQWRRLHDAASRGFHVHRVANLREVDHAAVVRLYEGILDVLRDDTALRILCGFASFLSDLCDLHVRLKIDCAATMKWADAYLLPTMLPVVVAALHRSQATHTPATHSDLCETTLNLLSQLSRYATNPQVSVKEVVRTQWNQVLLQLSLYCIRMAGRGGQKRAPDYGLPPPTLPSLDEIAPLPGPGAEAAAAADAPSAARQVSTEARQWAARLSGNCEPELLVLLDRSNASLSGAHGVGARLVDTAESVTAALAAYAAAWEARVRFGGRSLAATAASSASRAATSAAEDASVDVHALLSGLRASYEAVHAFQRVTRPASEAAAEATPFLSTSAARLRHLGPLVRFMEQHLRVQELLSRLSEDELDGFLDLSSSARPAAAPLPTSLVASASTVGETAPLVLLDFVGYLTNGAVWVTAVWTCNTAETVMKIELKRHRHIPAAVSSAAATAILSQLRAVPPPQSGVGKPSVAILRALLFLSDLVSDSMQSLLGYHRRCVIRGLLSNPTRDQYRVFTFALKQALAYVQEESRQYCGLATTAPAAAQGSSDVDGMPSDGGSASLEALHAGAGEGRAAEEAVARCDGPLSHLRLRPDGSIDRTWLGEGLAAVPAAPRQEKAGLYYVKAWASYAAQQRLESMAAGTGARAEATVALAPYLRGDLNREFRYYLSCLVCLVDASMEAALLYLRRAQGDGEDDIRRVVVAVVLEVCRTAASTTHALLSLSPAVRRACCQREEAELLWALLCIVATFGAAVPRDPQERLFGAACAAAVGRVVVLTHRLVQDVISEPGEATLGAADDAATSASSTTAATLARRPLATVLVRGAQLLLRDPHSLQRTAIRLGMRDRERDDLSAVLVALQVLMKSAEPYAPGRALLHDVWARLALELSHPLLSPPQVAPSAGKAQKRAMAKAAAATKAASTALTAADASAEGMDVARTVISKVEYAAVLRGLASAAAAGADAPVGGAGDGDGAVAMQAAAASRPTAGTAVCDVEAALANVTEDAAGIEAARRRSLHQSASDEEWHFSGVTKADPAAAAASEGIEDDFDVAESLASGAMPVALVIDAVVAHAAATVRAAGGRSSADVKARHGVAERGGGSGEGGGSGSGDAALDAGDDGDADEAASAVGFLRLVRQYRKQVTELFTHVPLRDIVARPQAEALFACLGLLHGGVSPAAEDQVWTLLADKWQAELVRPAEGVFLHLQETQLAAVRQRRNLHAQDARESEAYYQPGSTAASSHSGSATQHGRLGAEAGSKGSVAVPDAFAATSSTGASSGDEEFSVLAAAEGARRHHWSTEVTELPRHDDVRGAARGGGAAQRDLDTHATGMDALSAMPDPLPVSVVLTLLKVISRQSANYVAGAAGRITVAAAEVAAHKSWLADGGRSGSATASQHSGYFKFTEVFVTHTARSYWLLRPRLEDAAWVVWAIVERGMRALPADGGVRRREWDRVCRQWRVPVSLEHAHAVQGAFLTPAQRRHVAAWAALVRGSGSSTAADGALRTGSVAAAGAGDSEEVVVLRYLQAAALYTHLLSMTIFVLGRLGVTGDLGSASFDAVRRRVQAQLSVQPRAGSAGGLAPNAAASRTSADAMMRELYLLTLERQTTPAQVNRNHMESAGLQILNVMWCIVRHMDTLTHTAIDAAVAQLRASSFAAPATAAAAPSSPATPAALLSFSDQLRGMVGSVVQDALDMIVVANDFTAAALTRNISQALLTGGFSCEPLQLRASARHGRGRGAVAPAAAAPHSQVGTRAGGTAARSSMRPDPGVGALLPAVKVIAAILSTGAVASVGAAPPSTAPADAASAAGDRARGPPPPPLAAGRLDATAAALVVRAELFVGSPTLLALLSPQFVQRTISRALERLTMSFSLGPIAAALDFYLSRRGVPLAPLLQATTELLSRSTLRTSALHTFCERLACELTTRKEFQQALAPPTIASAEQGAAGSISNEVVISFLAVIARHDVHVTKKTLAHLLHDVMHKRLDVFGQPPTENRQGKLTLVQVGTTVDATIDTTNPLYTPTAPSPKRPASKSHTGMGRGSGGADGADADDAAALVDAFSLERLADATTMSHRKALAALTLSLPTVVEVAMHMDAMRTPEHAELRRAVQMLKAADDARRERVAIHRSQAQAAIQQGHATRGPRTSDGSGGVNTNDPAATTTPSGALMSTAAGLDASLHLEDPYDFGVALMHLRYALRKVVHASLRRLLHQQGPRMLSEVAELLQVVDPSPRSAAPAQPGDGVHGSGVAGMSGSGAIAANAQTPRPFDGVLAGTTRVLLSRAVLCAQAIGYDSTGAVLEMMPPGQEGVAGEGQPVLKLPVPALQPSAVEAAISATAAGQTAGTAKRGRHQPHAGHSTGKIGLLTKEEKATVHQRVELERDAAVTVGLTTALPSSSERRRVYVAVAMARRGAQMRQRRRENAKRHAAQRPRSLLGGGGGGVARGHGAQAAPEPRRLRDGV